jgi:hypothetical protein
MKRLPAVAFILLSAVGCRSAEPPQPVELETLAARAKLEGAVVARCRAEFQSGRESYAVALETGQGGRYLALDDDGRTTTLSAFTGRPDLSCYSRADADQLNRSIGQSETIHGQITPRWNTTVVCGFTDDTTAQCWQYAPADQAFVNVGGWTT